MAKWLIDCAELIAKLPIAKEDKQISLIGAVADVMVMIAECKPVDAVEAIRCRNCIHDGLSTCPMCYIEDKTLVFINHDPDFYCGKGERRCEE